MELPIIWSYHAIERVTQRFPGQSWRKIPVDKIVKSCENLVEDDVAKVRQGAVRYVVKHKGNYLLIMTVIDAKNGKKLHREKKRIMLEVKNYRNRGLST